MRLGMTKSGLAKLASVVAMLSILIFAMFGCQAETTTPTGPTTPTEPQTLRIGILQNQGSSVGVDCINTIILAGEMDNENGGLTIGGEQYLIEFVVYDTGQTTDSEMAALEKMVYEDNLQFIMEGGGANSSVCPPITEPNGVLLFTASLVIPEWDPAWQYTFDGAATNALYGIPVGWFSEQYPDLVQNVLFVHADDQISNMLTFMFTHLFNAFGVVPEELTYPASLTDVSSVGTRIAELNPGVLHVNDYSPVGIGRVIGAARDAGYTGQAFCCAAGATDAIRASFSPAAMDGYINGAFTTDFDPPLNQMAEDFREAWIAEYGSWTSPSQFSLANYYCLRTALQNAGSIDPDEVAAVLASGMTYDSPAGPMQMVSRPDRGITRTVDSVATCYIKQMTSDGQANLIATIGLDDAIAYYLAVLQPPTP